ncbi:hypothetical protein LCGC14_1779220 [marine sediment metagenome]|uniref:Uncharacterized protein n=1 Tax=marine sediment metagenome TaxID=412755 RepID=A0A0F9GW10_9ZZZZ
MHELAQRRGLKVATLEAAGIERIDTGWLDGWYAIPYPNATGVHKWRYSNPTPGEYPKLRDDPGSRFHIYNPLRLGPGEPEVWFAEGEFDTLCLVEAGLPALGIHGTQNVPDEDPKAEEDKTRSSRFEPGWKWLFAGTKVVVMFDNDESGWPAGRKLAHLLDGEVFDRWDDDYGDVNDWWIGDSAGMKEAISYYRWMT